MKLAKNMLLSTILVSGTIFSGGPALAQDDGDQYGYCRLLQIPPTPAATPAAPAATPAAPAATPAAPAATPAAPAATPAAPAATPTAPAAGGTNSGADAAPKVPNIADLLKETTDAGDIVNRILSAAAPAKPADFDRMYDDIYQRILTIYIEPSRIEKLSGYGNKYKGKITNWEQLDLAIKDLVGAVGDRWTWYQSPVDLLAAQIDQSEKLVDLGAGLRLAGDGTFVVEHITPGSTAQLGGIREGDTILSINGKVLKGLTKDEAGKFERKHDGDQLRIVSLQDGVQVENTYIVHAPADDANAANADVIYNNIGYIKLPSFMSMPQFEKLVESLADMQARTPSGLQGIVLDLRYNGGGLVNMAKTLIALLQDRGVVLHERERNDRVMTDTTTTILPMPEIMRSRQSPQLLAIFDALQHLPLVILINGSSASASEIVTGALKDARPNTTVMGERSFGKGVEMMVASSLPTCGELAITSAAYTTPSGQWLHNVGIKPDIVVHQVRGSTEDAQLLAAVKYLRDKTATNGANVANAPPGDTTVLGKLPDRPLEPKVVTWKQWLDKYSSDIVHGAVGAFLLSILGGYCWLTRRKNS